MKKRYNEIIGKKIKSLRGNKYTQEEMSDMLGLTRASIINLESGRHGITIESLLRVCAIFKCTPDNILPPVPMVTFSKKQYVIKRIKRTISAKFTDRN